jgi:hypothetical protein
MTILELIDKVPHPLQKAISFHKVDLRLNMLLKFWDTTKVTPKNQLSNSCILHDLFPFPCPPCLSTILQKL